MSPGSPHTAPDSAPLFATTRWSVVLAAGGRESADGREALAWLCERYWYPLYACVRARGNARTEAEDLTQSFFAWLLEGELIARAEADRGRFRSFLLGCMNHFLANEWRREHRMKRGGGHQFIPLDDPDTEDRLTRDLADPRSTDAAFDRLWATLLLDRALARLREECDRDGRAGRFEALKIYLTEPDGALPLGDAAKSLGVSVGAVKVIVHRLRRRYRELVLEEIAQTVAAPDEIDAELRHLFAALGG